MSYVLPDKNVLVSFSGGRTSAFMLYKILEAQNWTLPEKCKVVFANTGREMPETYDFVQRCSDEPTRLKTSQEKFYDNWYPLADAKQTKHHIMAFWKQQPFDLQITAGFGNCDGCFLKSEKNIAALWRLHPERAEWWVKLEEMKHGKTNKKRTFHKDRTYKEMMGSVQDDTFSR